MVALFYLQRIGVVDGGLFGVMTGPGLGDPLRTVELPWRDNVVRHSCVPPGTYDLVPRRFNRGKYDAVELAGVPGRTHILIHKANWPQDLLGCIGVGVAMTARRRAGATEATACVYPSSPAFGRLMDCLRLQWDLGRTTRIEITGIGG